MRELRDEDHPVPADKVPYQDKQQLWSGEEGGREGGREGGEEEDSKGEGKVCWQLARWRCGGRVGEGARTACRMSL